jgi:hypothetical protein
LRLPKVALDVEAGAADASSGAAPGPDSAVAAAAAPEGSAAWWDEQVLEYLRKVQWPALYGWLQLILVRRAGQEPGIPLIMRDSQQV